MPGGERLVDAVGRKARGIETACRSAISGRVGVSRCCC
jgi:hypothetical protein